MRHDLCNTTNWQQRYIDNDLNDYMSEAPVRLRLMLSGSCQSLRSLLFGAFSWVGGSSAISVLRPIFSTAEIRRNTYAACFVTKLLFLYDGW